MGLLQLRGISLQYETQGKKISFNYFSIKPQRTILREKLKTKEQYKNLKIQKQNL